MTDPLEPQPQLLVKLGSLIVHAEEALDPKLGSHFDFEAFKLSLCDVDVQEWLKAMHKMALIPEKRTMTRGRL